MINKVIINDAYLMHHVDEQLESMINSKLFTMLDLTKGYHQMKLHKYSKETTAFSISKGLFQ